eukprot:COSAG06_NODE_31088_length_527_cov_0.773364_1_plen_132_part_10
MAAMQPLPAQRPHLAAIPPAQNHCQQQQIESELEAAAAPSPKQWECCSNQAVTVRLVDPEDVVSSDAPDGGGSAARCFHPTYTHQVFNPEEKIAGYTGLDIALTYNASTLAVWPRVSYAERREPADDLDAPL